MDISQIAVAIVVANLGVLALGAIVALVRSIGRRRHGVRRSGDRQTQESTN